MKASDGRVWLSVPYERRDEAKHLGALWGRHALLWYAPSAEYVDLIERFPYSESSEEAYRRRLRAKGRHDAAAKST
jgi:hypothetical protein